MSGTLRHIWILVIVVLGTALPALAAETDQFMTWDVELEDSSALINAYINEQAEEFVMRRNRSNVKTETREEMVIGFYLHLFEGLQASRLRRYIWEEPRIDRWPSADTSSWKYQRDSIFRGLSFPYVLPMARTIRVGEVYLGVDKLCHFFGFGRRYFQRFERLRTEGVPEAEAIERVIRLGLSQESSLVGGLVDGIISHGDLEANFQGFQMARRLCSEEQPYFIREEGTWRVNGVIDLRNHVTPHFDESYAISHFTRFRWRKVAPVFVEKYCNNSEAAARLRARFARYETFPPSDYIKYVTAEYERTGNPRFLPASIESLCERAHGRANNTIACAH